MPGQQWTTLQSQQRRRLVTWIIGTAGALILIGALIAAIAIQLGGRPNQPEDVAQQADGPLDDSDVPPANDAQQEPDKFPKEPSDNADSEPDSNDGLLDQSPVALPIDQSAALDAGDAPAPDIPLNPPSGFEAPQPKAANPIQEPDSDKTPDLASPNITGGFSDAPELLPRKGPELKPNRVTTLQDDLGELASLLEESDTSLKELQDQNAQFQAANFNRLPKYYVEVPDALTIDLERQLDLPIAGLLFESPTPLTQMVRLLSRLSGTPITIDVRQIRLMRLPINPSGTLKVTDTTVREALKSIADQFDLNVIEKENSLIVTKVTDSEFVTETIDLPAVPELTEAEKQRFIASIKTLIAPEYWVRDEQPATIELENAQLVVTAPQGVQEVVRLFVDKLDQAARLSRSPDDQELKLALASRWSSTASIRKSKSNIAQSVRQSILEFLQRVERESGATVVVDWFNVLPVGWTPATEIPGEISEDDVDQLIDQLAASLDLVALAVDETTFLLTTNQAAAEYVDLEVYPIAAQVAQQAKPGTLENAVFQSIGDQVQSQLVKVIFEPKCQCLIVVAPQSIQRQIESLINLLNQNAIQKK